MALLSISNCAFLQLPRALRATVQLSSDQYLAIATTWQHQQSQTKLLVRTSIGTKKTKLSKRKSGVATSGYVHVLMIWGCRRKRTSEYYDPCQEAANKSIKCMNRNNGDRDMCQDYFQFVDHPSQPSEACLQNEPLMSHPRRQAGRADRIHEKQSLPGL